MATQTVIQQPTEREGLRTAQNLEEAANSDNSLDGYAAINASPESSEIAQYVEENRPSDHDEIATIAYGYYLDRGCEHGYADEDWYRAEQEYERRRKNLGNYPASTSSDVDLGGL